MNVGKMPVYNNREPLGLSEDETLKAKKLIGDIVSNMQFFGERLSDRPNKTDVHTHLALSRSYFNELAEIVGYGEIIDQEMTEQQKTIKELNGEIARLYGIIGDGVTAEKVTAKLREYEQILQAFAKALGFRYVPVERISAWMMEFRFTSELTITSPDAKSRRDEMQEKRVRRFSETLPFIPSQPKTWDLDFDVYHAELLDTDRNKRKLEAIIRSIFPNAVIREYRSHLNDFDQYSSETTVLIPFTDLEICGKKITEEEENEK